MGTRNWIILFSVILSVIVGVLLLVNHLIFQHESTVAFSTSEDEILADGYVGSRSCRECHERFYDLWSPSHHGRAMQPVSDVIQNQALALPDNPLKVGNHWFEVSLDGDQLAMIERDSEDAAEALNSYPAKWALGGRNIFYFLTPFSGGRLQTMPLAYDINRKEWYSNPASAVRHFVDMNAQDEEIDWMHSLYTFNTTCHSCHVSQLEKNYNVSNNTYHTTWKEPGINCETCHGPSEEHIRVCREAALRDEVPDDLKIISVKNYTPQQHNAACASCHAKGTPLTKAYIPGEPFFQHFDLLTLENPDYYPDGRDLGENYTMTSWFQSKCTSNQDLNCVTCHTSSGRYRFKNRDNDACASCHQDKLANYEQHTHHDIKDSVTCVSCHMPTTEFARMTRSDHSMLPPTPVTTIEFGSPNACNLCHTEEDAAWANEHVISWHGNYQDDKLTLARLVHQGRNNDFTNADQMLKAINNTGVNTIFRNSLIRILSNYQSASKTDHLLKALDDESPLIRSSAAEVLGLSATEESKNALLRALQDSVLIVRNKASGALAHFPKEAFSQAEWQLVENGFREYEDFIMAFPDTWSAHYNMGNYLQGRNKHREAVQSYEKAIQLEEEALMPMVNASIAYSILGNNIKAEEKLLQAIRLDPENPSAHLNYGLLMAEAQRTGEAKKHLSIALEFDSTLANAAYNLAVLSAPSNLHEAISYIARAYDIAPEDPRNGYTYAFYIYQAGNRADAVQILEEVIKASPEYIDAYLFLANIHEETNNIKDAIAVYTRATQLQTLPMEYRQNIQARIKQLGSY